MGNVALKCCKKVLVRRFFRKHEHEEIGDPGVGVVPYETRDSSGTLSHLALVFVPVRIFTLVVNRICICALGTQTWTAAKGVFLKEVTFGVVMSV